MAPATDSGLRAAPALLADVAAISNCTRRGGYTIGHLERPGEHLSREAQDDLLELIAELTSDAHRQPMDHYWEGKRDYFDTLDDWWFAVHSDRLVAWCGARIWDTPHGLVMTPENATTDRRHVRARLGQLLFIHAWLTASRRAGVPLQLVAQTSSPLVYQIGASVFGAERLAPAIYADEPTIDPGLIPVMEYIANRWYPEATYDRERSVVRAALPYAFYKQRPLSPHVALNRYFTAHLRLVPGDALVFATRPTAEMLDKGELAARDLTEQLGE